ncbi:MAG: hypothetical protein IT445_14265 [Phycisphaeraceae bacterium]|nr:hypothetical protein [Phycisphaeraceae bacterium]
MDQALFILIVLCVPTGVGIGHLIAVKNEEPAFWPMLMGGIAGLTLSLCIWGVLMWSARVTRNQDHNTTEESNEK